MDDRLAFYTYFDSDKPFSSITGDKASGTDRPDVALFDLGLGFDSSDATHPITIVEFKKPRRDNYTLSDNPIIQVRRYVEKLRAAGKAVKFDGTKLRNVGSDTPFMCYIVADIEPTLLESMKNLGNFTRRAGTDSFYFWDPGFRIMMEVMSYDEVLASAKARNQAFFAKLGID